MPALKVGVFLPSTGALDEPRGDVVNAARQAEDLGFESVWVVDQLLFNTPMTLLDSTMVLASVAAVTERVKLGFGVMVVALRPTVWVAKQIATLQHLSGERVILGVGAGEDRHPGAWDAAAVPKAERGRRTDLALSELPDLIAGRPCRGQNGSTFELIPGAAVPPIVVGGMSDVALNRAIGTDGWFCAALAPAQITAARDRLAELAAARNRPIPPVTNLVVAAITGDPAVPDERSAVVDAVANPAYKHAFSRDRAEAMVVHGPPAFIAEYLASQSEAGVERVVISQPIGSWSRQADLLAEAVSLLD